MCIRDSSDTHTEWGEVARIVVTINSGDSAYGIVVGKHECFSDLIQKYCCHNGCRIEGLVLAKAMSGMVIEECQYNESLSKVSDVSPFQSS